MPVTSETQPCKACGQPVGQRALTCPHCGERYPSPWMAERVKRGAYAAVWWALAVLVLVFVGAYMCAGAVVR